MFPLRFAVYKGLSGKFGAVQFLFQRPHFFCSNDRRHKVFNDVVFDGSRVPSVSPGLSASASFSKDVTCPVCNKGTLSSREGCIFLDTAATVSKDKYDWDNKISLSLSITDVSKLLHGIRYNKETKLYHDPGAKSDKQGLVGKTILMKPNEDGGAVNGCMFSFFESNKNTPDIKKSVMVPLTGDEVAALFSLLEQVIPQMLSWF